MKRTHRIKRGLSLAVSMVLLGGILTGSIYQANAIAKKSNTRKWKDAELGELSAKYETGSATDPGIIATVNGDIGGTSYGIYMFASGAGTPYLFAQWCQDQKLYENMGDRLVRAYEYNSAGQYFPGYGSNFNAVWQDIADEQPRLFAQAQHDYVEDQLYEKLVSQLEDELTGFRIKDYTVALKNVLWSRAVQNGVSGAYSMIRQAFSTMKVNGETVGFAGQSEAELIEAIYARNGAAMTAEEMVEDNSDISLKGKETMSGATAEKYGVEDRYMRYFLGNSGAVQLGVYYRLRISEPSDAMEMLYENKSAQWADGTYSLADGERYLDEDLTLSQEAAQWKLTAFESGYYTISTPDGQRLSGGKKGVSLEAPSVKSAQKWIWSEKDNSWQNKSTETYLSVSEGKLVLKEEPKSWAVSSVGSEFELHCASYPQKDRNVLPEGKSSFPIRGNISSASEITEVTVSVLNEQEKTVIGKKLEGSFRSVSLEALDDEIPISKLEEGEYRFLVTAEIGGQEVTVIDSPFRIGEKESDDNTPEETEDKFTVTFDPAGGKFVGEKANILGKYTIKVELGDTYGTLPEVSKDNAEFAGWFMDDGTQVAPNSIAAAGDHTLTAKYGALYTYTFLKDNGEVFKSGKLSEGALIPNPGSITKPGDSNYVYSFSHWVLKGTNTNYVSGTTAIGTAEMTFTPVFNKEKVSHQSPESAGGEEPGNIGTVSSNYLSGITPGTTVAELKADGYTVYDGTAEATSGTVATGMTAKGGKVTVTVVVTGDTSGDGKISITDVVQIRAHLLGKSTLSGARLKAADLNGDGKVTVTDAVQATSILLGRMTLG